MQSACGITDNDITAACLACIDCIENNRCRVRTFIVFYQLDLCTICPDLKLIDCCRTEGISCSKQHLFAVLTQIVCQFSDGCGLADTVYTNDQQNTWFGAQIERFIAGKHLRNDLFERSLYLRSIGQTFFLYLFAKVLTDMGRGDRTHIRHNQVFFQFLKKFFIDFGKGI